MPLAQSQILALKDRLKRKGLSDLEIEAGLERFTQENEMNSTGPSTPPPAAPSTQSQASSSTQKTTSTPSTPESGGVVASFFTSLYNTGKNYVGFVGEAVAQGARAVADPTMQTDVNALNDQVTKLSKQSLDFITQAKQATDPAEKVRLLDESRKIDIEIEKLGQTAGDVGDNKKSFLIDENKIADRGKIAMTGAKATAGAASLVVPGGSTIKTAVALGAASGALFGLSEGEGIDVDKIISGAVGGAVGGAVLPIAGKALGKTRELVSGGYKKLTAGATEALSEEAAKRINKASPSMWQKAVEEHGINLNEITKKYVRKAGPTLKEGVGYDDLLGPIAEKGRGGLLKTEIEAAEGIIEKTLKHVNKNTKFTIDEIITALQKEKKELGKLTGNENNIAALEEFISGFQAQYGKGITPRRLLELKRIADSQFGKAVADENTGSVTAQAQKMVANAARAKLKKLLPAIKESLDTETEIYTLQPVLNRARGIINTQGSEIRVGSLKGKGIIELILNIPEAVLSDPKRASRLIGGASLDNVSPAVENKLGSLLSSPGANIPSRTTGGIIGATAGNEEQSSPAQQVQGEETDYTQEQEGSNIDSKINHGDILPQSAPETPKPFGGRSKVELLQLALAQGATKKDLEEIAGIYEMIVGKEEDPVDKLLQKRKLYAESGFSTSAIDKQLEGLGITRMGASGEQTDLVTQIGNISTVGERNGARAVKDIYDVVNTALSTAEGGVSTGPISAIEAKLSKMTTGPNKTAQLEKDLKEILRTIRKESTGVAYSPQEIKDLENEIPSIAQQEGNVKDSLVRLKQRMLQKLTNYGLDVSGEFEDSKKKTLERPQENRQASAPKPKEEEAPKMSSDEKVARANAATSAFFSAGPQALDEGAKRLSESDNKIVSTIGKAAKVATSFIAPSDDEIALIVKGYNDPKSLTEDEKRTLADSSLMSGAGLVTPLSNQKVTSILPKLDQEDVKGMISLIDLVRTKTVNGIKVKPDDIVEIEKTARYIAEGMKINPDLANAKLANTFEQILNTVRSKIRSGMGSTFANNKAGEIRRAIL